MAYYLLLSLTKSHCRSRHSCPQESVLTFVPKGIAMGSIPATVAIEHFLTVLRASSPAEQTYTVLCESIDAWLPYYRGLRTVLGGNILLAQRDREALFYLFARATLDGSAETVRGFFALPWRRVEFSHTRLVTVFPQLCALYQLTGETEEVSARLCALQRQIVAHRSAPAVEDTRGPSAPPTLYQLFADIEHYLTGLLRFLAQNSTRVLLSSDTRLTQRTRPRPHAVKGTRPRYEVTSTLAPSCPHKEPPSRRMPYPEISRDYDAPSTPSHLSITT